MTASCCRPTPAPGWTRQSTTRSTPPNSTARPSTSSTSSTPHLLLLLRRRVRPRVRGPRERPRTGRRGGDRGDRRGRRGRGGRDEIGRQTRRPTRGDPHLRRRGRRRPHGHRLEEPLRRVPTAARQRRRPGHTDGRPAGDGRQDARRGVIAAFSAAVSMYRFDPPSPSAGGRSRRPRRSPPAGPGSRR